MKHKGYPAVVCRLLGEAIERTGLAFAAEVGVARGETSALLLREHPGLRLWMVDPWRHDPKYMAWLGLRSKKLLGTQEAWDAVYELAIQNTQFAAERRTILRMPSLEAAPCATDGSLTLVFIDAEHTYPAVTADCRAWWPKVAPGGMLVGDDYCIGRVRKAAEQWAAKAGVAPLLREDKVYWAIKPSV